MYRHEPSAVRATDTTEGGSVAGYESRPKESRRQSPSQNMQNGAHANFRLSVLVGRST
jgi:hypothetical protein